MTIAKPAAVKNSINGKNIIDGLANVIVAAKRSQSVKRDKLGTKLAS